MSAIGSTKNFQSRMAVLLISIVTLVLSGFMAVNYFDTKRNLEKDLESFATFIADQQAQNFVSLIWNVEKEASENALDSVMVDPRVYGILIKSPEGEGILYGRKRDDNWKPVVAETGISGDFLKKEKDIARGTLKTDKKLGSVQVYLSRKFMEEALIQSAGKMLLALVVLDLILFTVLFAALKRGVILPIRKFIDRLNTGTDQIFSASLQMASTSQSLAEGSSQQASASEETTAALEEVVAMIKQNAGNLGQADHTMKEVQHIVQSAAASMEKLIQAMKEIVASSKETSKIVKTIDEIAFQTNLLALNAAVEAARAGQAGAGFAVVADEVRNLALRASQAAKNTSHLIDVTLGKIKIGEDIASVTHEEVHTVADHSGKVAGLISEIAQTSDDQVVRIEQVTRAVADMDKVTQSNAANAEEAASSSEQMSGQAEMIKQLMRDVAVSFGIAATGTAEVADVDMPHTVLGQGAKRRLLIGKFFLSGRFRRFFIHHKE